MEAEEEKMQFLGFFGVYKESYKIIFSYRKIFTRITFTLFFLLSIFFLTRILVTQVLFAKNEHDSEDLTQPQHQSLLYMISDCPTFFLILLFFSLFSTSEVVYNVASFYTAKEVTFYNVITLVDLEVWKRLVATFLCTTVAFFVINVLAALVAAMWGVTIGESSGSVAILVFIVVVTLYLGGYVYLTAVWLLASVVTTLEGSYGFEAMVKSKELIKGKMGLSIMIALKLNVLFFLILLITMVVVNGWELFGLGLMARTAFAIVCFLVLSHLLLLMLVIQTVLYFVCKSYHHEIVDMSASLHHLEVNGREDYEKLEAKDDQQDYVV
ncbi:uncharacterized protein LOC109789852 [Cajanus cajan]|uniref:Uncharacterized protein n=1 Tax=Cajanus cajan TaxID=3821 RepID=A0A151R606_CAJCA|nr:uncharacterized protein LOC109789852 [Cajanus cajan]KYP37815.1 hypothetical protein KK1_040978 [Cajanus cajan]